MLLSRSEFQVRFLSPLIMDDFPSAGWRSGLGVVLRSIWCDNPHDMPWEICEGCQCAFGCNWKTTVGRNPVSRVANTMTLDKGDVPKPYVLNAMDANTRTYKAGECARVQLTLVGYATREWADWFQAFHLLGQRGFGKDYKKGNGRFIVESVLDCDGLTPLTGRSAHELLSQPRAITKDDLDKRINDLYEKGAAHRLTIVFLRPLQLRKGKWKVTDGQFDFRDFWDKLTKRIEDLAKYCDGSVFTGEFVELAWIASQVRIRERMTLWLDQSRLSRPSDSESIKVDASGIIGHVTLESATGELAEFLPLLVLGEWLHVGRGCDFGNGAYRLMTEYF